MSALENSGGLSKSAVLVGFMAVGKSRIGRNLAERLRVSFVDADKLIEAEYGRSVADIFRELGEPAFRQAEKLMIARLLAEPPQVIAIGGGAFVDEGNRTLLNKRTQTVWLDTPFELILPRLKRSSTRPLAAQKSEAELRSLWEERRSAYAEAHIRIDTSDADVDRIVERVIEALS